MTSWWICGDCGGRVRTPVTHLCRGKAEEDTAGLDPVAAALADQAAILRRDLDALEGERDTLRARVSELEKLVSALREGRAS